MIILMDYDELAKIDHPADIESLKKVAGDIRIDLHVQLHGVKQMIKLRHDNRFYSRWLVSLVGANSSRPFDNLNEVTDYIFKTLYYMN